MPANATSNNADQANGVDKNGSQEVSDTFRESAYMNVINGVASEIKLRDLIFLLERLNGLSPEERTVQFPGLPKNRADILPAGLAVVVEWMRFMKQDFLIHSFRNLRFGIAQEFFNSARA